MEPLGVDVWPIGVPALLMMGAQAHARFCESVAKEPCLGKGIFDNENTRKSLIYSGTREVSAHLAKALLTQPNMPKWLDPKSSE